MFSSFSSSRSLKSISHASYSTSRAAAKLAVDVWGLLRGEKIKTERGEVYPKVKGQIGSDKFKALCCDAGLTLATVNFCQGGLEALGDSSTREALAQASEVSSGGSTRVPRMEDVEQTYKAMRDIINHDYLVLEINPGDSSMETFFILAHKGILDGKPGIHIEHIPLKDKSSHLHKGVLNYSIRCDKNIALKKISKILEEWDPHYNLRHANCWDYATGVAKRLVKECAHVPGISEEEKNRLEEEHDNFEANFTRISIFNSIELIFKRFFSGSTVGSAGMISKVESEETGYKSLRIKQSVVAGVQKNFRGALKPTLFPGIIGSILGMLIFASFWGWQS